MNPLSRRIFFFFTSRSLSVNNAVFHHYRLRIACFSTSSNSFHSSSSPSSSSSYSFQSRRDEESRRVRVSVWWDFENCSLPAGGNVFKVAQSITAAIRANGIKGPVQITAFGDMLQLSRSNQEALSATGINLTHIPHGGKNSADRSLLVNLMYWVSQNPPPAHLFLISGDKDFAEILHRLRMDNYNILLASTETAPSILCSAASIMWNWSALVKGENLTGKYFNQPPDGPCGSWYGHYRVPLEDPFAVTEQPACPRHEELSECNSDSKLRPVPKSVVKQIRNIIKSYPRGVSLTELSSDLRKNSVSLDKDLYGFKKFSRFLLSMPHILKLQSGSDGRIFVTLVGPKTPEPVESSPGIAAGPVTNTEEPDSAITPKVKAKDGSTTKGTDESPSLPPTPEPNVKEPPRQLEQLEMKLQDTPHIEKVTIADETEKHLDPIEESNSTSKVGFFKKMFMKWRAVKDEEHDNRSSGTPKERSNYGGSTEKPKTEEKLKNTNCQSTDAVGSGLSSSSSNEAVMDDQVAGGDEACRDKSSRDPSFFKKIISWCMFWGKSPNSESLSEQSSEKMSEVTADSGKPEVCLSESFWREMEAFLDTPPNGSVLVLQSRSREQMAQNLQKHGPVVLRSLSQSDLLHMVNLLISEKRWVEECQSQTFPFKLIRHAGKRSNMSNSPNSKGLRSLFISTSQSNSQKLQEHKTDTSHQNLPYTAVSPPVVSKKSSGKSRNEILADCQKLVDDIVKEHPEGFNMGSFRRLFLDRYGYGLDIQKLGYQKLATLLQIMPGVRIESAHIVPCNFGKRSCLETDTPSARENSLDGEVSDRSRKGDDPDSPWEELGPVANIGSKKDENDPTPKRRVSNDYEALSDDYISDSEDESSSSTGSEGQGKPRINSEDSSLLRILDSWYSAEEERNRKEGSVNVDGMGDCSQNVSNQSATFGADIRTEAQSLNSGRKQKPLRSYSFVADQVEDPKDKLIDSMLSTLKKSGESKGPGLNI